MSTNEEDSKRKYGAVESAPPVEVIHEAIAIENVVTSADNFIPPTEANNNEMKIPDHFIRLGCMAFTCSNTEWPTCFGGKSSGTCLCVEGSGVCFKPIEDERACFIFWAGNNELVIPRTCCKLYEQCFCFECFMALPNVEEGYKNTPIALVNMPDRKDGTNRSNDVVIYSGMCCTIDSCYCKVPECLGCYRKGVVLCCEAELIEYKMMCWDQHKVKEDTLCILAKGNWTLIQPYTCCKGVSQRLCCDQRVACPCDDDVPCVYSMLPFCTCCVNGECNVTCCATINDVLRKGKNFNPNMQQQQQHNQQAPQVVTNQPV